MLTSSQLLEEHLRAIQLNKAAARQAREKTLKVDKDWLNTIQVGLDQDKQFKQQSQGRLKQEFLFFND